MKLHHKILLMACLCFMHVLPVKADPITMIIKEGIKKVIVATDLKVQRLQNESVLLQNAQKLLENKLSEWRLNEIADWGLKQRDLFETHYQSLRNVRPAISGIKQVADIISHQTHILSAYQQAWQSINTSPYFKPHEKIRLHSMYAAMIRESAKDTDKLILLISNGKSQMEDASRYQAILDLERDLAKKAIDIQRFNNSNFELMEFRKNSLSTF